MLAKFPAPFLLSFLIATSTAFGQDCSADALINRQVRASETDAAIPFELFRHQVWINPACEAQELLLVHLPGTFDNPSRTTLFPALAANNGYHVVSLKYPNDLSAQSACRESEDPDCYADFRREIVSGTDSTEALEVDRANSIENRLQKLLQFLAEEFPAEAWDQFFDGEEIMWEKVVISGHSQGGGHAGFMAKDRTLARVIMFASPNDFDAVNNTAANWLADPSLTPDSVYYAFGNRFDDIVEFGEEYLQWNALGMGAFGDTINVLQAVPPYNESRMLYTTEQKPSLAVNHSLMITDEQVTLDENGAPIYEPVWKYLLGVAGIINEVEELADDLMFRLWPNPTRSSTWLEFNSEWQGETEIRVITLDGRMQSSVRVDARGPILLDLSTLSDGVYQIQAWFEGRILSVHQLVVAR